MDKPNGVIVYLSRSTPSDLSNIQLSLRLLDRNFNDKFRYPVVIFHEDFTEKTKGKIRSATNSEIRFEKLEFNFPSFLDPREIPERILNFGVGYFHMCRFFSGLVFQHPALAGYDWFFRLDTDSFILDEIDYDLFRFMEENNHLYGYITMVHEPKEVIENLWETAKRYMQDNNIQPTFPEIFLGDSGGDKQVYYTNFTITRLDFWRSKGYVGFFDYLDKTSGIYKNR